MSSAHRILASGVVLARRATRGRPLAPFASTSRAFGPIGENWAAHSVRPLSQPIRHFGSDVGAASPPSGVRAREAEEQEATDHEHVNPPSGAATKSGTKFENEEVAAASPPEGVRAREAEEEEANDHEHVNPPSSHVSNVKSGSKDVKKEAESTGEVSAASPPEGVTARQAEEQEAQDHDHVNAPSAGTAGSTKKADSTHKVAAASPPGDVRAREAEEEEATIHEHVNPPSGGKQSSMSM